MSKRENKELLLWVWMRLEEIRDLTVVCGRGYEAEIPPDGKEIRNVIAVIERQVGDIIEKLDKEII